MCLLLIDATLIAMMFILYIDNNTVSCFCVHPCPYAQQSYSTHTCRHSFVVFVDENRAYHISEIQPALEGVPEMVEQLNVDNGFDVFVREMRAKFREL